jgi:hypothetical protein
VEGPESSEDRKGVRVIPQVGACGRARVIRR